MEVTIRHFGNVQFEAGARGHRVLTDQPATNGGSDQGMTPPELLLAALGTCAGHYAAEYLKARKLPADGLEVTVRAEKVLKPARLAQYRVEVVVPGLDAQYQDGVLRAVKACLIHNSLLAMPSIETVVRTSLEVPVG